MFVGLAVIVAWMLIRGVFAADVAGSMGEVVRVVAGCMIPYAAISRTVSDRADLKYVLKWLLSGSLFASLFGLYQLTAFYVGLPQLVAYDATSGGHGRISAFTYEASSFISVVLVGVAALAALISAEYEIKWAWAWASILAVTAVLANARTLFVEIPFFVAFGSPLGQSPRLRRFATPAICIATLAGVTFVLLNPGFVAFVHQQFLSVFNPNEASSNARRLTQYRVTRTLIAQNPIFGIGPGNLYHVLAGNNYGVFDGDSYSTVVVNDMWLQAWLDGGIILLAATSVFVLLVMSAWAKSRRNPVARPVFGVWIAMTLGAGLVGSNFFETSRWVVLAIAGCCASVYSLRGGANVTACDDRRHLAGIGDSSS